MEEIPLTENNVINNILTSHPNSLFQKFILFICVSGTIISGSVVGILIPLCTIYIQSEYAIILISIIEICIIFTLIMFYIKFKIDKDVFYVDGWMNRLLILLSGLLYSLMVIAKIYASNPSRTSPIMQSTIAATALIFSVGFSKLLLNKSVTYKISFIVLSIITFCASVLLPLIYELIYTKSSSLYLWVLLYLFGTICRGLYSTLQEKYFLQSNDFSIINLIKLLFYTNIVQLITIVPSFGLEYVMGHSDDPFQSFLNSTKIIFTDTKTSLFFHGFIMAHFLFLGFSIWLNSISSNYVMITSVVITPMVTIFFVIFPNLTPMIIFPLYIIIPSLLMSVVSTITWIYGERSEE